MQKAFLINQIMKISKLLIALLLLWVSGFSQDYKRKTPEEKATKCNNQ